MWMIGTLVALDAAVLIKLLPVQLQQTRSGLSGANFVARHFYVTARPLRWHHVEIDTKETHMINGLRTVLYPVADLTKGKAWYSEVFGCAPYFDQPFYVGFEIGGFELGMVPDGTPGTHGCTAYWGVDDIEAEVTRIVALGGRVHSAIQEVGESIKVAELLDPFGNVLGLIYNPHFDLKAVR
jgi:predicted enzyme related to lactoylglutathione lyase